MDCSCQDFFPLREVFRHKTGNEAGRVSFFLFPPTLPVCVCPLPPASHPCAFNPLATVPLFVVSPTCASPFPLASPACAFGPLPTALAYASHLPNDVLTLQLFSFRLLFPAPHDVFTLPKYVSKPPIPPRGDVCPHLLGAESLATLLLSGDAPLSIGAILLLYGAFHPPRSPHGDI